MKMHGLYKSHPSLSITSAIRLHFTDGPDYLSVQGNPPFSQTEHFKSGNPFSLFFDYIHNSVALYLTIIFQIASCSSCVSILHQINSTHILHYVIFEKVDRNIRGSL